MMDASVMLSGYIPLYHLYFVKFNKINSHKIATALISLVQEDYHLKLAYTIFDVVASLFILNMCLCFCCNYESRT